jgi:hypothetical protein
MNPPASCAIVCRRQRPEQVERLLASITTGRPGLLVYLIEQGPFETLRALAGRFGASYRHQRENPGNARTHNLALREAIAAGSAYHFILNPEIQIPLDGIGKLLAWMEQHPDVGLLAPRVHYPNGRLRPLCKLLPHPLELLVRRFFPPAAQLQRPAGALRTAWQRLHPGDGRAGAVRLLPADAARDRAARRPVRRALLPVFRGCRFVAPGRPHRAHGVRAARGGGARGWGVRTATGRCCGIAWCRARATSTSGAGCATRSAPGSTPGPCAPRIRRVAPSRGREGGRPRPAGTDLRP